MSEQLFKYAGYSVTESGQTKARFGNDMVSRIKKLTANSNTNTWFYNNLAERIGSHRSATAFSIPNAVSYTHLTLPTKA